MKYSVEYRVYVSYEVDAEDAMEAIEKAEQIRKDKGEELLGDIQATEPYCVDSYDENGEWLDTEYIY